MKLICSDPGLVAQEATLAKSSLSEIWCALTTSSRKRWFSKNAIKCLSVSRSWIKPIKSTLKFLRSWTQGKHNSWSIRALTWIYLTATSQRRSMWVESSLLPKRAPRTQATSVRWDPTVSLILSRIDKCRSLSLSISNLLKSRSKFALTKSHSKKSHKLMLEI